MSNPLFRHNHKIIILVLLWMIIGFQQPVFAEVEAGCEGTVQECMEQREGEETLIEVNENENNRATIQDNQLEEITFESNQNFFFLFLQMILALVIVIALILFLLRYVNKKTRSFRSNQVMENIGGVPLGPNRSIQMVKVGERLLIVGVGETIQLLKEISDENEIDKLLEQQNIEVEKIDEPITRFAAAMNQFLTKKKKKDHTNEMQFSELLNKQLKDVSHSQKKIHEAMKEHKND